MNSNQSGTRTINRKVSITFFKDTGKATHTLEDYENGKLYFQVTDEREDGEHFINTIWKDGYTFYGSVETETTINYIFVKDITFQWPIEWPTD